jgi:TM2 domain-containing membrane protein YozV
VAVVLAWLIPGAGHLYVGQRKKGLFFMVLLCSTFFVGLCLTHFRSVPFKDHPFYAIGQFGSGTTLLVNSLFTGRIPERPAPPHRVEIGILYMSVAGLLNLMVMLSLFPTPRKEAQPARESPTPNRDSAAEQPRHPEKEPTNG